MKKRFGFLVFFLFISPFMMAGWKKKKDKSQPSLLIYAKQLKLLQGVSKFEKKLKKEEKRMKQEDPMKHTKLIGLAYTTEEVLVLLNADELRRRMKQTIKMQNELKKLAGMEENEENELDWE